MFFNCALWIFLQLGDISEVRLVKNFKGKSKGYAYIEFTDEVFTFPLFIINMVISFNK